MIQTMGKSFRIHLRSCLVAAVRAINDIKDMKFIALGTTVVIVIVIYLLCFAFISCDCRTNYKMYKQCNYLTIY